MTSVLVILYLIASYTIGYFSFAKIAKKDDYKWDDNHSAVHFLFFVISPIPPFVFAHAGHLIWPMLIKLMDGIESILSYCGRTIFRIK